MSTVVTSSCIFDSMSRSSHPHDALDTLMQRLESLGTDNGSTDGDYSFAGQPPALVSTSPTVGGYHGFGSGAGAASVGSGTGEYMLLQSVGAFMADLAGRRSVLFPKSSGKLVRYEILGEDTCLYEVLVWEAFPHVL